MPPARGLRRDLRLSVVDAACGGVMAGVGEAYVPAFALAVGMPPVVAGLVATAPLLAGGLLQLIAPRAIERVRSLRTWTLACVVVQTLAFVPLIVVALTGVAATPIIFAAAAAYWGAGLASAASWNPWIARVVPQRIRGKFFGRRQGLAQATMLVGLLAAGATLYAAAGTAYVLDVYAIMFAIALVARTISLLTFWRMGRGVSNAPRRRMRLRSVPPKLRGTPRATLLGFLILEIAAVGISGPFIIPYLLDHERLSYIEFSVFTATIVLAKIIAMPVLGRAIQRVGVRSVLSSCALAIAPIPIFWIVSDAYWWLLAIQVYSGVAWAGFELGVLMALFDADDDAERTTMQVAFSALQAFGSATGSFLGGALLGSVGSDASGYFWVFMASAIARFAAAILLVRELPRLVARLPVVFVARAWTLAIRPWGGAIIRPIVEGIDRLRR